jgi:hypothetical protein
MHLSLLLLLLLQMTAPETKRGGKPAIHSKHREVTGQNAHDAKDYRAHAKQVGLLAVMKVLSVQLAQLLLASRTGQRTIGGTPSRYNTYLVHLGFFT